MKATLCMLVILALFGLIVAKPEKDGESAAASAGNDKGGPLGGMIRPIMEIPVKVMKEGTDFFSSVVTGFQDGLKQGMGQAGSIASAGKKAAGLENK